jgi:hypothetical protein
MKAFDLTFTNHRDHGEDWHEPPFFSRQDANLLEKLVFTGFDHPDVRHNQIGHTIRYCIQSLSCGRR